MPRATTDPALHHLPLFAGCSKRERRIVAQLATTTDLLPGQELVRQGDIGREVMVIAAGNAVVWKDGLPIASLERGDVVGELSFFVKAPRNATVVADTDMTVAVFDARAFSGLLDESPAIMRNVLRTAVRRLATSAA
jgi:CRP-like cAMP-binding protein